MSGAVSAPERPSEDQTVEIHGIASQGAGVGRLSDGRVVFVHRTLPGEEVRIRITEEKKSWARGRLLEVLRPSEARVEAPCPHYDVCGGCTLEHLAYERQLHWKGRMVADALERIGKIPVEEAPDVAPSPLRFGYRSRVTFTLLRLADDRVVAGFHRLEEPGRIVDVGRSCLLPEPGIAEVWEALRSSWGSGARLLPSGRELRLTLRSVTEGVILVIEGGRGPGSPETLLQRVAGLVGVHVLHEGRPSRRVGLEYGTEEVLGESVRVAGAAFLQVNRAAGDLLQRRVLERVEELGSPEGRTLVDAYCGLGVLGRRLAAMGATVVGIELDRAAVEGAREGRHPRQEIRSGAVEEVLPRILPADGVLVNPPRTGLHDDVPPALVAAPPPWIVYVSCDPATLARDVKRLGSAYALASIEAFDLFPQTAHVESLAVLTRRDAP